MGTPLLQINNLTVSFESEQGSFTAVNNLNLSVCRGEIRALVGESGSGKSVTSMSVLQPIIKTAPSYFIIPLTNPSI
jgi:ABC-type dipeptide/oligopeptide/nickel transport system ATPase component